MNITDLSFLEWLRIALSVILLIAVAKLIIQNTALEEGIKSFESQNKRLSVNLDIAEKETTYQREKYYAYFNKYKEASLSLEELKAEKESKLQRKRELYANNKKAKQSLEQWENERQQEKISQEEEAQPESLQE